MIYLPDEYEIFAGDEETIDSGYDVLIDEELHRRSSVLRESDLEKLRHDSL